MKRTVSILPLGLALIAFAMVWYVYLLVIPIWISSEKTGLSFAEFIQWRTIEFREPFFCGLKAAVSPLFSARLAPGKTLLLASLSVAVCFWSARLLSRTTTRFWDAEVFLVCLQPIYGGILAFPLEIKRTFRSLAAAGLTNQSALGAGIGEAFSILVFGLWGSAICLALAYFSDFRSREIHDDA